MRSWKACGLLSSLGNNSAQHHMRGAMADIAAGAPFPVTPRRLPRPQARALHRSPVPVPGERPVGVSGVGDHATGDGETCT